ncbi:MAG: tRNA (adenosine(37)-N6)-threonylcarbamoyltransferase complex dimerization subunit type 1 TsaB [Fibrobacteres bacterium]|nr:tRNA (adenosine(37)-N6)-threonylcarbamoyltransferase complex dimerization subunit type 1 TsaB [Fibrobacterota bacterium]
MPAPLLILDLSSALYVGLWDGSRVAASRIRPQGTRGENAHALIDECLGEAGMAPGDLAALGVGVGPGSFTGIRVCGALAQGLAFPRRLPLYPFSSLAAVETCLPPDRPGASAIAANAGKWYVRIRGGEEALLSTDELLGLGSPDAALAISGSIPERERLEAAFGLVLAAEERLDFGRLAALALAAAPAPAGTLRPNYLAASAAEDKLKAGLLGVKAGKRGPGPGGETSP